MDRRRPLARDAQGLEIHGRTLSDRKTAIAARLYGAAAVVVVLWTCVGAVAAAGDPDRPPRTSSGRVRSSADSGLPPALGPRPAKVVVIVFSDFQCPVCERVTDATHQIAEEWPGAVRVEFWQHPLAIHANAEHAAIASLAAHRQGRFWEMHDVLFAHHGALDPESMTTYARDIGLDLARFRRDTADAALALRVRRESALAEALEADGTPAFVVNGRVQVGWGSWIGFRGQVEQELRAVDELIGQGADVESAAAARVEANAKNAAALAAYRSGVGAPTAHGGRSK